MEELDRLENRNSWKSYLPVILVFVGSFAMLGLRLQIGPSFINDGALMMLALACYIFAALFQLTNLYAPSSMAEKIGFFGAALGVFFNLSSWLVRWVAAYDHEIAVMRKSGNMAEPWVSRYVPFANLYDMSLAFAFGAGIATLLFAHRRSFRILAAFTLPLAALILTLARFIGNEFIDLPPVLNSYWRPIHVGVASLSYGIALVCFAVAVIYLLKAGTKVERLAIWSSIFGFAVIASISKFSVLTGFVYRAGLFVPNEAGGKPFSAPFRIEIPNTGIVLAVAGILLGAAAITLAIYYFKENESIRRAGMWILKVAFVAQIISIVIFVSGIKSMENVEANLRAQLEAEPAQYVTAGRAIAERQDLSAREFAALTPIQLEQMSRQYLAVNGPKLYLSLNTNPVEFAGMLTALAGTFFVLL